ncbi:MAG: Holliday junction branch migration protein RuvA [Oligoflexales bacterium]|nr:Holliday junction branch migration protein RuvA [Oligoflexales bacterium]
MIHYLSGRILKKLPTGLILDVGGLGYGLELPLCTLHQIAAVGEVASFWVYMRVREDSQKLYGFLSWGERQIFELLIHINGVGPKIAMAILSTVPIEALQKAADFDDAEVLERVPGVGRRTAEKILLDLKPRLARLVLSPDLLFPKAPQSGGQGASFYQEQNFLEDKSGRKLQLMSDLLSALENLGFKEKVSLPIIKEICQDHPEEDFPELVRLALLKIHKPVSDRGSSSAELSLF